MSFSSCSSSTPLARTPIDSSDYSSYSSCSCANALSHCQHSSGPCGSHDTITTVTGGPVHPLHRNKGKLVFSEQVGIVNNASTLSRPGSAGGGGQPQPNESRSVSPVNVMKTCAATTSVMLENTARRVMKRTSDCRAPQFLNNTPSMNSCLPAFTSRICSNNTISKFKDHPLSRCSMEMGRDVSELVVGCCLPCSTCFHHTSQDSTEGQGCSDSSCDRTIDKAAAEIIAIARKLGEREVLQHTLPTDMAPLGITNQGERFSIKELMSDEVRRLEDKLHKAECLEKEVEKGLQSDRSILEKVEETLVSLGREENRLEWKAEELSRRTETLDMIQRTRGSGCLMRLKQEAEKLKRLIEELEKQECQSNPGTPGGTPRGHGPLVQFKSTLENERNEILEILQKLREEKASQLTKAKELRTQIFDDRRRLDLMLEKHIHLVQEINRLKSTVARNTSTNS